MFYVETLADLAKEPSKRGPAEVIVKDIANKFPEMGGSPCSSHLDMAIANLLGQSVPMDGRIPRAGGRPVKKGTVFEQTPEEEHFSVADNPPPGNLVAEIWDARMRRGYREEPSIKMDPEQAKKLAKKLVEELTAFRKQKTIQLNEGDPAEDEMISVARSVRRKRGSWYQVPRDLPDPKDDD